MRSDAELLAAHVDGDPEAFGTLFARHRDRLWAVALRTTGNPDDAADGLQEGVIAALTKASTFRGGAAVTTWLHRIVVNACLDRLRRNAVRRAQPLPEDLDRYSPGATPGVLSQSAASTGSGRVHDPAQAAVASDERAAVLDALGQLPADQRAALVLVDMEGYPVAEAAQILECAVGTVKSRCARGRSRLAVLLAPLRADRADGSEPEPPARVDETAKRRGASHPRGDPIADDPPQDPAANPAEDSTATSRPAPPPGGE